jgi:hypothetical protein
MPRRRRAAGSRGHHAKEKAARGASRGQRRRCLAWNAAFSGSLLLSARAVARARARRTAPGTRKGNSGRLLSRHEFSGGLSRLARRSSPPIPVGLGHDVLSVRRGDVDELAAGEVHRRAIGSCCPVRLGYGLATGWGSSLVDSVVLLCGRYRVERRAHPIRARRVPWNWPILAAYPQSSRIERNDPHDLGRRAFDPARGAADP